MGKSPSTVIYTSSIKSFYRSPRFLSRRGLEFVQGYAFQSLEVPSLNVDPAGQIVNEIVPRALAFAFCEHLPCTYDIPGLYGRARVPTVRRGRREIQAPRAAVRSVVHTGEFLVVHTVHRHIRADRADDRRMRSISELAPLRWSAFDFCHGRGS